MNSQNTGTLRSSKDFWFACVDIEVLCDKELSQSAKFIFAILCIFATTNNRGVWPSNDTVAKIAGVSVRTVIRAYNELEARGAIARSERYDEKDGGQASSYTTIVGHNAPCYNDGVSSMTYPPDTGDIPPMTPMTYKEYHMKDTKDSLTGEAPLPGQPEPEIPDSPEESYSPSDAPDIMRPTAELFLHKTGRKTLTEADISALRELSAHQYPSRVQKEIDRACERFRRKGKSPGTLTLSYIAGALRNQPTLGRKSRAKTKPDPMNLTQAEIDAKQEKLTEEESLRELERLEAEMREEGC